MENGGGPDTYQYHQVAMAVGVKESGELIHGLITTVKTALIHPLVQTLPFDLAGSVSAVRSIHGALGMININVPDHRRDENYVALDTSARPHRLLIHYHPAAEEPQRLTATIKVFRKVLRKLGCFAPTQMAHVRPMGRVSIMQGHCRWHFERLNFIAKSWDIRRTICSIAILPTTVGACKLATGLLIRAPKA